MNLPHRILASQIDRHGHELQESIAKSNIRYYRNKTLKKKTHKNKTIARETEQQRELTR